MEQMLAVMRSRHSAREPFDLQRRPSREHLSAILEAARWAPTPHNMQNYEIVVIDEEHLLASIAAIPLRPSATFLRENYAQLSFSQEELLRRGTGLLAQMFPPAWRAPEPSAEDLAAAQRVRARGGLLGCPTLLLVLYDHTRRAPASEGDALGFMGLGCVMQNMWLMAEALGIGMHIVSALSAEEAEGTLRALLAFPPSLRVAFACRLGYPLGNAEDYLRVRRELAGFVHHNRYARRGIP